jgi:hypothetical protein
MSTGIIGQIMDRQILYLDPINNPEWESLLPENNWALFAIADNKLKSQLSHLAKVCLNKNVAYSCAAGEASSDIDDEFDMEIVSRKMKAGDANYDDTPIVTWHEDFSEGFWFATTIVYNDTEIVNTVVCVDLTQKKCKEKILELIDKINSGWLPED